VKRAVALCALVALLVPASAAAHATLLRTMPANGAVLAHAPQRVVVQFDDVVRVGHANAAVDNATGSSVLGGRPAARGRVLTLPLRRNLARGAYSVRWSIVSDDGHLEQGVIAFAVGAGSAPPTSVLGASTPLSWSDVLLRLLYYGGILAAGGVVVFGLVARPFGRAALRRPLDHLVFFALLAAFLGGSGMLHGAVSGTRYDLVLKVAVTVALVGGAAAALAPMYPRAEPVAFAAALALLAAPTLAGHALDRNQPLWLSIPADLAHVASAGVWLGGLLALAFALPRANPSEVERGRVVARFSTAAGVTVAVLAVTGVLRALTELNAVRELWTTSYGRSLLVKTALFATLLAFGLVNRTRLLATFRRLRRSVLAEIVLVLGVVGVVAVLTELRPGRDRAAAAAAAPSVPALGQPPALPPPDAVVDARELGGLALAVARTPGRATVTLVDADANGANGHTVAIDGAGATPCGAGCYQGAAAPGPLRVTVDGRTATFDVPATAPDGSALLARLTRAYEKLRSVVFEEQLASSPTQRIDTVFVEVAPDKLRYRTAHGPSAVVIGARRWDSAGPGKPYVESPQTPIRPIQPYWNDTTNVHVVAPGVLTFLDRTIPAWFRVELRRDRLPRVVHMTAAAHFMVDRYLGFDTPVDVSPPSR